MKEVFRWGLFIALVPILWGMSACQDPCANLSDDPIGGEFFTITYRDSSGGNPLNGTWRTANVEVFIDSAGTQGLDPDFHRLRHAFSNGVLGPFAYTEAYTDPGTRSVNLDLLLGEDQVFDYYIKKDTFGIDTFTLRYLLISDECRSYWSNIEYSFNGEVLSQYSGQRQAEIVITE
jgi:hypothetical protein